MTNIFTVFKRLFNARPTNETTPDTNNTLPTTAMPEVPRDLFVNDTPPESPAPKSASPGLLGEFFDIDFFQSGLNDGYRYHQTEIMNNKLRSFKSEFRSKVAQRIQDIRQHVHDLKIELININGLSEATEERLKLAIGENNETIRQLERELELSVDGEGLIAQALNAYVDGFQRGATTWLEEELLTRPIRKF